MSDYSKWLTEERLAETEIAWSEIDRSELISLIERYGPKTVVEFCCGTGWIPKGLSPEVEYTGFDANLGCINLATEKNPDRVFICIDIREIDRLIYRDMALAFACLKHFSLAEWDEIYGKVLRSGRRTLASIYMRRKDKEDESQGFPHTAVSRARMERVVKDNGHRVVRIITAMPPLINDLEPLVITEAV